jgi:GAF domain-containing protein
MLSQATSGMRMAEDVTFLSLVANQAALAIDDALNFTALQQALLVERQRTQNLEASDELLRALSPVLDIREVFLGFRRLRRLSSRTTA